jgi:hypothetical protein
LKAGATRVFKGDVYKGVLSLFGVWNIRSDTNTDLFDE